MTFKEFLEYTFQIGSYSISVVDLLLSILILILARFIFKIFNRLLAKRLFTSEKMDAGRKFAAIQFVKYFIYTLAFLLILNTLGINLSVLLAGSAALLIGVGLGLQQTFNDCFSGLLILLEGTVEVDDIVEVNGLVAVVQKISLRTSLVNTRDGVSIIIPNSKLVSDNVTNWSHNEEYSRFQVKVGVAYNSDVKLVEKLVLEAAASHPLVLEKPVPKVEFTDFGNSALEFNLHYYSHEFLGSEFVKSDLRFKIFELFRENTIEIPFPQRDVWIRKAEEEKETGS